MSTSNLDKVQLRTENDARMERIFNQAGEAAMLAAKAHDATLPPEKERGLDCGFAWVTIKPARGPFITWCRQKRNEAPNRGAGMKYGDNGWNGGWQFWCPGDFPSQSISVMEAGANAFADVLRENGIECTVGTRLD